MGRVSGKKAIVTGGAQGLGEATAWMLAREGAKVTVTDVNGEGADAVAAAITAELGAGTGIGLTTFKSRAYPHAYHANQCR